ncbi:MAG TPA: potassium-transporting ATPase subunit KdpA [Nitrososphaera sp.]
MTAVIGGVLGLAVLFGLYIARLIAYETRPLERTLSKVENGFFRVIGIDKDRQMTWKQYMAALLITNGIAAGFLFAVLILQESIPILSDPARPGFTVDLAFMQASSFITNTNLQHYAGDQHLTVFSQMVLIFMMFVAPGSGIAAAFAFIRGFIRKNFGLGNYYVDLIRIIVTLLFPVAFLSAILLIFLGVPQTLDSSVTMTTIEGQEQTIVVGPVASLESIKELGSNGGGYYYANSGHPFENPNGLSNMYEIILILVIPVAFPIAYGKLVGVGRGASILLAMLMGFGFLLALGAVVESGPGALETRFGSFNSVLFNVASISTNTGAANSGLVGMSPNAVISLLLGMFIQAVPGADGTGMMTMIVYVILTLFIVGLMVGKTPEYMSMKISPKDIKLAVFIFLLHPALILIPTAIAFTTGNAQAIVGNDITPMAYTQTLYEYTSAAANNGSDYFGTSANTPFWNWSTGIVMLLGRYVPIALMLAIAGSFTLKDRKEVIEPIKTKGGLFIAILLIITFMLTALTFFPFIAIGPFSI